MSEAATAVVVAIADVRIDGGTQVREATDESTVARYADLMRDGTEFPPVRLYRDAEGILWLADGFHRRAAALRAGRAEIAAVIQAGSRRDALFEAITANACHPKAFTNADKRKVVMLLLQDEEWSQFSDRKLAKIAGVSNRFVGVLRGELSGELNIMLPEN